MADDRNDPNKIWGEILKFTGQYVPPAAAPVQVAATYRDLGRSPFAEKYGALERQGTGHWCSRCRGIWFGGLLEVTCPACGNRRG